MIHHSLVRRAVVNLLLRTEVGRRQPRRVPEWRLSVLDRLPVPMTDLPQSHNWEPVSPVVLGFMEMAASDSECLLRPATDGTVSAGNLEGLVFQVITDIEDPSRNDRFRATFLTTYQLFGTSERLFHVLKRRFESSELDPVAARSRYPYVKLCSPFK